MNCDLLMVLAAIERQNLVAYVMDIVVRHRHIHRKHRHPPQEPVGMGQVLREAHGPITVSARPSFQLPTFTECDVCGGPGCSDSFRRFLSGSSVFRFRLPEGLAGGLSRADRGGSRCSWGQGEMRCT